MKKKFLLIAALFFSLTVYPQSRAIDSLRLMLHHATIDTGIIGKAYVLSMLASEYQTSNPDTAFLFGQKSYKIAMKNNDRDGIARAASVIGTVYLDEGNYSKALEYFIQKLKIDETRNDPELLTISIMLIAGVYHKQGDYNKAFKYSFQADSIIDKYKITNLKLYNLFNMGDMYEKAGKLTTALKYTQKAYELAVKEDNIMFKGAALNNLGNVYAKMGNTEQAIENYKNALPLMETVNDKGFIAECSLGLAKKYLLTGKNDSSLYYGLNSYKVSKENGLLEKELDASVFLTQYYKTKKDIKNAFTYQENILKLKDSIFSKERIAKSLFLSMEEDVRQKDLAEKKIQEEEERIVQLQYLIIGLFLPVLFFITVYLSNRKIKPKYIEFLGVVSLLFTFEFIMLLVHPVIVSFSNHMPFYELLILAFIASVLTPLHHNIENWLLQILTKKEKITLMKIRIQ